MIPIRDVNPTHRVPVAMLAIIVVNVVVFLLELGVEAQGQLAAFFDQWAVVPAQLISRPETEFFTPFTAMFLHGGWSHLLGNMLYLWIFGDNIEDQLGVGRFLIFYFVCGLAATVAQLVIDPTSPIPMLGASGAIAGVLGGYLVLFPQVRVVTLIPIVIYFRMAHIPAYIVLGFWFVLQLFNGAAALATVQMQTGGVAFFAHIGGFVAGLLLVRLFRRRPQAFDWSRAF